jgi:hypothetical protein
LKERNVAHLDVNLIIWDVRQTGCNRNFSPLLLLMSVLEADKRNIAFP